MGIESNFSCILIHPTLRHFLQLQRDSSDSKMSQSRLKRISRSVFGDSLRNIGGVPEDIGNSLLVVTVDQKFDRRLLLHLHAL